MMRKIFLLFLLVLLISLFVFIIPVRTALVFYEKYGPLRSVSPLKAGDTFQIIFTHSIHLTDVVEKYKITENLQIEQYEFVYEEFRIGMPSNAEEGEFFVYEDGKYHIKNMNNVFESLQIRNGKTVSKHRLVWGTKDDEQKHMVWFNDYFEPGEWYTLKVERSLYGIT